MNIEEEMIYKEVKALLDQHQGGEVLLEESINAKSYFRIESALRYDYPSYWYLAYLTPFNGDNQQVFPVDEQKNEEALITKMILTIDSNIFQEEMQMFTKEDVTIILENSKKNAENSEIYWDLRESVDILNTDVDRLYYEKINETIENNLQQIIDDAPQNMKQEEAVQYFSSWLVKNMQYDEMMKRYITTGNLEGYDLRREISAGSINDGEGTCTGFSLILMALCNRVGIEAYVVLGETEDARHGWVAIKIEDNIYYKDPTSEIEYRSVWALAREEQFYNYFHRDYEPFIDLFEY